MNKKIIAILGVLLLVFVCCIGVGIFAFMRLYDPSATLTTVEEKTQEFVLVIQEERWEDAYALTAEQFQENFTAEEFQQITEAEIGAAIATYRRLEVCDWNMVNSNGATVLQGSGLFYYGEDERVLFTSSVIKEGEIWRILGLQLSLGEEATPFGKCAL